MSFASTFFIIIVDPTSIHFVAWLCVCVHVLQLLHHRKTEQPWIGRSTRANIKLLLFGRGSRERSSVVRCISCEIRYERVRGTWKICKRMCKYAGTRLGNPTRILHLEAPEGWFSKPVIDESRSGGWWRFYMKAISGLLVNVRCPWPPC